LNEKGFEHYETSAFARDGRRSRHNLNYWQFGDYLGIGAGAHGKLSFPDHITRHSRIKQPREYLAAASTLAEERGVPAPELAFEFMLNALRLVEGFEARLFSERTGLPLAAAEPALRKAEEKGLVERDWQRIRPTERGRLFLNELLEFFLAGGSKDRG
jgi:oxygen-independent coproporphyrinogen-3 oxidase